MYETKLCKLCKQPVIVNDDLYDVFEQMHWLCFHIIYEHEGDPDEPCNDPSCPWRIMNVYKQKLKSLNIDPEQLLLDDWMSKD